MVDMRVMRAIAKDYERENGKGTFDKDAWLHIKRTQKDYIASVEEAIEEQDLINKENQRLQFLENEYQLEQYLTNFNFRKEYLNKEWAKKHNKYSIIAGFFITFLSIFVFKSLIVASILGGLTYYKLNSYLNTEDENDDYGIYDDDLIEYFYGMYKRYGYSIDEFFIQIDEFNNA